MTIDEVIHEKIRRRFNLPADSDVWFDIIPLEPEMLYGMPITGSYGIEVGNYFSLYPNRAGGEPRELATYGSWDEFVTDLERSNDD